jgi:serine/threonine-protein kinase HipA
MAKNAIISVSCFNKEIGRLGLDEHRNRSYFQYSTEFLKSDQFLNLFPVQSVLKRVSQSQVFTQYNTSTFRGLPPVFADSLPDVFGNLIFQKWLSSKNKSFHQISVLEQLAYVAKRGMGALEYEPAKELPSSSTIDLAEMIEVLKQVLDQKAYAQLGSLSHESLLNVFKIGSSAGGARPKVLISEHKTSGEIIPGDLVFSSNYHHYLVKLALEDSPRFEREKVEYCYYLTAKHLGINMMNSKLIDQKHFATERFDRVDGRKKHVLTASGLTGWDFHNPEVSSYENVFELAVYLQLAHAEIEEIFLRMVFNVVFSNTDDHLKNHAFIYDDAQDQWHLSPAYDLTYSLDPFLNFKRTSRALSINGKRLDLTASDLLTIADRYTIKNPKGIINKVQRAIEFWVETCSSNEISDETIDRMRKDFQLLA